MIFTWQYISVRFHSDGDSCVTRRLTVYVDQHLENQEKTNIRIIFKLCEIDVGKGVCGAGAVERSG